MTKLVKAINTHYDGKKFRSRLEARWAVYFNHLSWNYKYEHEGYELPSGRYLPDFYFPEIKAFGEVKPFDFSESELKKCFELSEMFPDHDILLLIDVPYYSSVKSIRNGQFSCGCVPVSKRDKYYPIFYEDTSNKEHFENFFTDTVKAIRAANEARFEFDDFNTIYNG